MGVLQSGERCPNCGAYKNSLSSAHAVEPDSGRFVDEGMGYGYWAVGCPLMVALWISFMVGIFALGTNNELAAVLLLLSVLVAVPFNVIAYGLRKRKKAYVSSLPRLIRAQCEPCGYRWEAWETS